jgi:hypothetical protein
MKPAPERAVRSRCSPGIDASVVVSGIQGEFGRTALLLNGFRGIAVKHARIQVGTGTRFSYDGEVVTVVEIHGLDGDTLLNTGSRLAQRPCGSELRTQDIGANRGDGGARRAPTRVRAGPNSSMTTATLPSRLAAVKRAGRFDAAVVGTFARYLAEAPDEKLFRMNPYRYAKETGTPERVTVDLFLYAANAGVVEFSWGVLCPICGSFVTTEHALRALNEERTCAICEMPIPPVIDDNVEVAFTVALSTRTIRFHAPEQLDFLRDSFALFFSPSVVDSCNFIRAMKNPLWFGTAPPGAKLETEKVLAPGRYVLALPEHHVVRRFTVDEGADGSA